MVFATTLSGQDLRCLSADDIKVVRQIIADREFQRQRAENAEAQVAAVESSREGWRKLYEAEKLRADAVQGGRIDELQKANTELTAANRELHVQAAADKQKIGEQNAQILKLRSDRKWWFGAGAVVGGFGGYYIGKNAGTIRAFIPGSGERDASRFGATFKF